MPDPQPRPKRFWLFAPYAALMFAVLAWGGWWLYAAHQVAARLDAARQGQTAAGFSLAWDARRITGYPFRLDVTLDNPRAAEPSGWALAAPVLKAEAYAYAPDHWVIVAPQGVTLTRPGKGAVAIRGEALRASVLASGPGAPRVSVEGLKLSFTPAPGAVPFPLTSAGGLGLHLRFKDADDAELFVRLDQGQAASSGLLGALAQGRPVSLLWQATLSKAGEAKGADWPSAVRAWAGAGGAMGVDHAQITAGTMAVETKGGVLSAGSDGSLQGSLPLDLKRAPQLLPLLAKRDAVDPSAAESVSRVIEARKGAPVALTFEAGRATLGPVAVAPAPKLY